MAEPIDRHVACDCERERAHGVNLSTLGIGAEELRVGLLEEFVDVGGIAHEAKEVRPEDALRLHCLKYIPVTRIPQPTATEIDRRVGPATCNGEWNFKRESSCVK
jgi:hypothetical protein